MNPSTSTQTFGRSFERHFPLLTLLNPGRLAPHTGDRPALCLANTRRRLELHYPSRHELSLVQDGDAVVARLLLRGDACFA